MTGPEVVDYPDRHALARGLADLLVEQIGRVVAERGVARIAVPGGTTPGPMLGRLGSSPLPWSQVVVTLTDERWVPTSSPRSNQRLVGETLFAGHARAAAFVPLYRETEQPRQSLGAIVEELEHRALPLDIAVLGMGADMHTASLFPGAVGLDAALAPDAPAAVLIAAPDVTPGAEEPRITLSARALNAAGTRHVMIAGAEKRKALERALEADDPLVAPVLSVLAGATVHCCG
jgi:6-phosphogluconolactonase